MQVRCRGSVERIGEIKFGGIPQRGQRGSGPGSWVFPIQKKCDLGVRGARHNPPNPRSFFCSQPSCDTVNKFVSETVLPNSFRAPTEPAWGHPRGVDQVKLRVLEASLVQGEG